MYSADLRKHYMLDNPSWKRDIMPEIIEGKNILDYVDPEIEAKLEALEMEEEASGCCCSHRGNSLPLCSTDSVPYA